MTTITPQEAIIHHLDDIATLTALMNRETDKWKQYIWQYHLNLDNIIIGYLSVNNIVMAQVYIDELNRSIKATKEYIDTQAMRGLRQ